MNPLFKSVLSLALLITLLGLLVYFVGDTHKESHCLHMKIMVYHLKNGELAYKDDDGGWWIYYMNNSPLTTTDSRLPPGGSWVRSQQEIDEEEVAEDFEVDVEVSSDAEAPSESAPTESSPDSGSSSSDSGSGSGGNSGGGRRR